MFSIFSLSLPLSHALSLFHPPLQVIFSAINTCLAAFSLRLDRDVIIQASAFWNILMVVFKVLILAIIKTKILHMKDGDFDELMLQNLMTIHAF